MTSDQSIFLVKSGGRILGPYSIDEIAHFLQAKEMVVIDEVCEPFRRWQMIRDHLAFAHTLEQMRAAGPLSEEITTNIGSITGSLTESLTDEDFGGLTEEIVYDDVPDNHRDEARPMGQARFQSAASLNEKRIRQEAEKSSRWMWALTLFVLVGVMAVLAAKRMSAVHRRETATSVDTVNLGLGLYQDGDYAEAMEILKKTYASQPARKEIWLPLALLMVHVEGRTVEARRLLQSVIEERTDSLSAAWTGMALTYITDGSLNRANDALNRVIEMDPKFLPATANLGIVALMNKEYDRAGELLGQALRNGLNDGGLVLQSAMAHIYKWKMGRSKTALDEAEKILKEFQAQSLDYQQELRVVEAYISFLRGDINRLEERFRRVLDVDPQQTDDFRHPILLARQPGDWLRLSEWCQQMKEAAKDLPSAVALDAICLYRQGQVLAAKAQIEKAVNQAPRDPLLQALYAAILRTAGFGGEASVALGRAIELDRQTQNLLPVLLQARFCQDREDYDCANQYWLKALQVNPKLPAGKVGMANVYFAQQGKEGSDRGWREVAETEANYKPLLRLKRKWAAHGKSN